MPKDPRCAGRTAHGVLRTLVFAVVGALLAITPACASLLLEGAPTDPEPELTRAELEDLCEDGPVQWCTRLGKALHEGIGGPVDDDGALSVYEKPSGKLWPSLTSPMHAICGLSSSPWGAAPMETPQSHI